ncbi:hypothetical protein MOQ_008954 [Trypanosoma cruzi marinkellei]|uniref:Uncharacterized protein n=1 Tax=Trypanosoma cruzi marinkellei TaxID=85056 RepID=K2MJH8_TRYCR|nr:hypothetical protein MOQ_008954 [Trypanosoma cruzi marinkellei]
MGSVPSREFHESPDALFFTRCGTTLKLARLPLTPHFFPSANCLAFQQLDNCCRSQSMKYGFTLPDGSLHKRHWCMEEKRGRSMWWRRCVCHARDNEDWDDICEEELELDPSMPCQQDMMLELALPTEETTNTFVLYAKKDGKQNISMTKESCSNGKSHMAMEELYHLLVTQGTVPAIVETNAEMKELYEKEIAWHHARKIICRYRQRLRHDAETRSEMNEENAVRLAEMVSPPRRFLRALPTALVAVVDSEDAMRKAPPKSIIPCDGTLHLMEHDGMLFLVSRKNDGYIVPPTPVRVVGCNSLLPAMCRGTPWLRGYAATPVEEEEEEEDAYIESLPLSQRPPVLCACHFFEASISEKAFGRALIEGLGYYALHSRMAGMDDLVARPVWHLGLASRVPLLHFMAEIRQLLSMAAYPTGMALSVRGNCLLFRLQEAAFRAVCQLLCPCTDSFAPPSFCQLVWRQNIPRLALYEYGGRIGVSRTNGTLCVSKHVYNTIQKHAQEEENNTEDISRLLVFTVVNPWQTSMPPSDFGRKRRTRRKNDVIEKEDISSNVFNDGDLLVYDNVRCQWTHLLQPDVTLETILLCWVKKLLLAATFRHDDTGWLRDTEGHIVQVGRLHIWCKVHDGLPYFFGAIPKFAKERRRRMLRKNREKFLQEEEEKEKESKRRYGGKRDEKDSVISVQDPAGHHFACTLSTHFKRHGDAANYFCNGSFTWNPYGRCR